MGHGVGSTPLIVGPQLRRLDRVPEAQPDRLRSTFASPSENVFGVPSGMCSMRTWRFSNITPWFLASIGVPEPSWTPKWLVASKFK